MAEAVVTFVLEQLGGFLIESILREAKLFGVNRAKAELRRMRCFLKDADARARGGDERVSNWVAEIREATYDLEDSILTYAAEVINPRLEGGFKNALKRLACLFCEGLNLRRVGSKIERISNDLSSLRSSLETYGIRELPASGSEGASSSNKRQRELRRDYSHVVEPDIVGLDEDIKTLVAYLIESGNSHRVVSICGMGGLGKTTLARKVYQHSKVRGHYNCVAWASISQQCQVSSVWKEILGKACPEEKSNIREMDDSEICRKLYSIQKEKKCLIVLDDIWTTEVWDRLSPAFPREETSSKILLTTRNRDLALYVDGNGFIHEPRYLDVEESWKLFEKVFTSQSRASNEDVKLKRELGREMLKHCRGLPLAIVVLRGLLSRKQAVFEWEAMHKNVKMYINKGTWFELQDTQFFGVSWVLGLSYDELPYHLKPCLLHFANFPEDYEIKVRELCQLWMAEGFVSSEEVGYECLHELVQRCMVLRGKLGSINGRIKTCRVHDLMRDFCLSKAQEENFVQVYNFSDRHVAMDYLSSSKVRRLAVFFVKRNNVAKHELLPINNDDSCLRSFLCFDAYFPSKVIKSWFDSFHMLRVLRLEGCTVNLPKEIGKLFHLHFLSLKNSFLRSLPSSICKLRYLEILDLRVSSDYPIFANVVMWRLDQLKHIFLPCSRLTGQELILEEATNLRRLSGILTSYPDFHTLEQLTNLTKLEVYCDENWERGVTFNSLHSLVLFTTNNTSDQKNDITPIILSCPRIHKLKVELRMEKLPEARQFSQELVKLTLDQTLLKSDPMPTLEKLPKLRILRLLNNAFTVYKVECSSGGFPCLESLCFLLSVIKEWKVDEGAFPSLCRLSSEESFLFRTFPDSLRYVTTLKEIVLGKLESDIVNGLNERGELGKYPRDLQSLLLTGRTQTSVFADDEEIEELQVDSDYD